MESTEAGFGILMTAIGGGISWLASWYYYFKARPQRTSVDALVQVAHKTRGKSVSLDRPDQVPEVSFEMVLHIIEAFERGQIFYPELDLCARTYKRIGDVLFEVLKGVEAAGVSAGQTLTPRWHEAREKAMAVGLSKAKEDILRRLKRPEK